MLGALGVRIDLRPDEITRCIYEAGIGFMFAPAHHPAMKHVGPTRVELGTRTIFNLLGPLSNPAGVKRQMVGVFSRQWVEPLANVLKNLGSERAYVVHGSDGLDEITTATTSRIWVVHDGAVSEASVEPGTFGISLSGLDALRGGDAAHNAAVVLRLLGGERGAVRDAVLLNAGAALAVYDAPSAPVDTALATGIERARESIDSGAARATALAPMVPLAPGRFSTSTGWPSRSARRAAILRRAMSGPPPAGRPSTTVTGRLG